MQNEICIYIYIYREREIEREREKERERELYRYRYICIYIHQKRLAATECSQVRGQRGAAEMRILKQLRRPRSRAPLHH